MEAALLADEAQHVLVVDDDNRIRALLSRYLAEHGYRVTTAGTADEARARLGALDFDLLVLDVMMPGESGFDLARSVRQSSTTPILMLTARSDPSDRIVGLEIGADDYLAKPFEPKELLLRIGSILRRTAKQPQRLAEVRFGPFRFDLSRGELWRGEEPVRITDRERSLLMALSERPGETVPRAVLIGPDAAPGDRAVDVLVTRLRRKIEDDIANPTHLRTVRGVGYRLMVDG